MKGVISIIWEKAACVQSFQIKGIVVPRAKFSAPVLSILCALSAVLLGADYSNAGPHQVMTVEFPDLTDGTRSVEVAPMRPLRRILAERRGTAVSSGRKIPVKVHAPYGDGPFPIIVLSHGAGGDWDTHHAQAHHLASHGYAVLCIEHVGSNRERMTQGFQLMKNLDAMIHDSAEVLARPRDVEFALDCAGEWNRSHRKLSGKLDLNRVGAMGHSFGAFTTMVVCGMRPALNWLTPTVEPGKGLGRDQRERRIRCGVALSPQGVGEPFFLRESFGSLQVPLLGVSGTLDKQQNGLPAENRKEAFSLWPRGQHRFVWLNQAKHLDFTDSSGADRRTTPSPTREDVQPVTRAATLLFFNAHLKGDTGAASNLTQAGLQPYLRGAVDHVEVLTK
jgi:predicted dienelactone hydrolase